MKALLVGIYDTNTAALAPEVLRAYVSRFPIAGRWDVRTLNLSIFSQTVEEMAAAIEREKADVVGLSAYVWNIGHVRRLVPRLSGTIVVGGPQCNGGATRLLEEMPRVDVVATGEGEETFRELLEHFSGERALERVAGIATRRLTTPPRAAPTPLDEIPSPYPAILRERPDLEWVTYETSRGCPFLCGFCTWGYAKTMRYHSLERVFSDLDLLLSHPSLRRIYLCDSSLLLDKRRAKAILEHVIERTRGTSLRYEFNAEHLDDEIVALLSRLPGNEFNFGVQTTNPRALQVMRRPFARKKFEASYRSLARRAKGAAITMDVIYGLPGDDLEGFKASLEYVMSLERAEWILTNPLILLPGSDFARDARRHGIRTRGDDSGVVIATATFPEEQMREAVRLSFFVSVVYFNARLRDAMRACARGRGVRFVDLVAGFFDALPFRLIDGGSYPYMVPSAAEDFRARNVAVARVARLYPRLVAAFDEYSGGAYRAQLSDVEGHFGRQYRRLARFARAQASTPRS